MSSNSTSANVGELVSKLEELRVHLRLDGENLVYEALEGTVDEELKRDLRHWKSELVALLGGRNGYSPIVPAARRFVYPASPLQRSMFVWQERYPSHVAYNICNYMRIERPNAIDFVRNRFQHIVDRHEILRTSFDERDGVVVQKVNDRIEVRVQRLSLPFEMGTNGFVRPFNLRQAPLWRIWAGQEVDGTTLLVFDIHHIIADGVSLHLLMEEFSASVGDEVRSHPKIHYKDYCVWQETRDAQQMYIAQKQYWINALRGEIQPLVLPTDACRPRVIGYTGARVVWAVDHHLESGLRRVASERNVSVFMLLLSTVNILLAKLGSCEDLIVGTPAAGRILPDLERMVGPLVNMLPIRTQPAAKKTFTDYLDEVRDICLQGFENQLCPLRDIVDGLGCTEDPGRNPLFDVVFVLHDYSRSPGPKARESRGELDLTAKFDLTITIYEGIDGWTAEIEYATPLFERSTIDLLRQRWTQLLRQVMENPGRDIGAMNIVLEQERKRFGELFAQKEPACADKSILEIYEASALQNANRTAVSYDGRVLTYRELDVAATRIAATLQSSWQVGPGTIVALRMERSLEMIIALIGIVKAGGAYLPIDPSCPAGRLTYMLEDSGARLLLSDSLAAAELPSTTVLLNVHDLLASDCKESPVSRERPLSSQDPAYVIYTSGSTGKPKGVVVEQHNLTGLFRSCQQWFNFNHRDVWTMFHQYSFDFSVWEMWGALLHGGKLVVVPLWVSRSPKDFHELLRREKVTVLNQTPSAFRQLLIAEELPNQEPLSTLRLVIFGGEALDLGCLRPWFSRYGDDCPQTINMYGITETTVHVTYRRIRQADLESRLRSVIGEPIRDMFLQLLDRSGKLVPPGVAGEIHVGGRGVARGYLCRPELTASRFNNFDSGHRLYRSGDLAAWRYDGQLEFIGRADEQVKIRGHRIELGEIESALCSIPGVREARVLVAAIAGDSRLVGFVIADPEESERDLRLSLGERLPHYMVPASVLRVETFPLTNNGKLDQRALLAMLGQDERPSDSTPLQGNAERELAESWKRVLGVKEIGRDANFFYLGGNSIHAIQVVSDARNRGISFSVQILYQYPTLGELAERCTGLQVSAPMTGAEDSYQPFCLVPESTRNLLPSGLDDAYPVSRLQLGMLYHQERDGACYHNVSSLIVPGVFVVENFQRALACLVKRHPILRTSFHLEQFDEPLQFVHEDSIIPLSVKDLKGWSFQSQLKELNLTIQAERKARFDVSVAPLIRFFVLELTASSYVLGCAEHHALLDGWSVARLNHELFSALHAERLGCPPRLLPVSCSFGQYVRAERQALSSSIHREFWENEVARWTPMQVGSWRAEKLGTAALILETAPIELNYAVAENVAATVGVPLKSVLLAVHLKALSLVFNAREVQTGLVCNCRLETEGGDRVLGLFLNTIPFHIALEHGSWRELIHECYAKETELLGHRGFPMSEIEQIAETGELIPIAFNFTAYEKPDAMSVGEIGNFSQSDDWAQQGKDSGVGNIREFSDNAETNIPLLVLLNVARDRDGARCISLRIQFNGSRFCPDQVEFLSTCHEQILAAINRDTETMHHEFSSLSARDATLIREYNNTAANFPGDKLIHELFEDRASELPEHIACRCGDETITYRRLNERSNQLARELRSCPGFQAGAVVGVVISRSIKLVECLLAVLKAGAAFVPVDTDYPVQRIEYVLENSKATILMTDDGKWRSLKFAAHYMEVDEKTGLGHANENISESYKKQQLAYIIYTSGSTGRPKGVMLSHRAVVNTICDVNARFDVGARDVAIALSSISFDLSIYDIFGLLASGGSLVMVEHVDRLDPARWLDLVQRHRVTIWNTVPSLMGLLVDYAESLDEARLDSLRLILLSGDWIPLNLPERIRNRSMEVSIVSLGGATEAAIWSICFPIGAVDSCWRSIPYGYPMANQRFYVLDHFLNTCPVFVSGDLYIGGEGLAIGYRDDPNKTASSFITHPLTGERLYQTGDLGRYLDSGEIEFLGRRDEQVKINGNRIELGEIEATLRRCPGVDAAVVNVATIRGNRNLYAYVVAAREIPDESIREYLRRELPAYMVPQAFTRLDALPLSVNGKVDRRNLPEPKTAIAVSPAREIAHSASALSLERLWNEVLVRTERIGLDDNFYELGGNSLHILRLVWKIRSHFDIDFSIEDFSISPTLRQLELLVLMRVRARSTEEESTLRLLQDIEALSDEEARARLIRER